MPGLLQSGKQPLPTAESLCWLFWESWVDTLPPKAETTIQKVAGPKCSTRISFFWTGGVVPNTTKKQVLAEAEGLFTEEEATEISVG